MLVFVSVSAKAREGELEQYDGHLGVIKKIDCYTVFVQMRVVENRRKRKHPSNRNSIERFPNIRVTTKNMLKTFRYLWLKSSVEKKETWHASQQESVAVNRLICAQTAR
jgi:hypothetical protein